MNNERVGERQILNALSVDVEEHFQVAAFADVVARDAWPRHDSRVRRNTVALLDLFDESGVRATFFVLGWVAEREPGLVKEIGARGHEVASHGYSHRLVYEQSPADFRRETERSRQVLQDASGQPVLGYRAASFSIVRRSLWALDVLVETGFRYDSSVFPVRHDRYGMPGAPRFIHRSATPSGAELIEFPPSTIRVGGFTLPVAGGGYLRLFPRRISHWAIRRLNLGERMPAMVYLHPWEIDPGQPRIPGTLANRLRHYTGLGSMRGKLRGLLERFRFGPVVEVLDAAACSVSAFGAATHPAVRPVS
jgi:polysaccharide deacetylase family protein (PEP-CTERM system associated)